MARQVRVLERLTAGRNPYVPAGNTCNILPPCISPTLALPLCLFLPTLPPSPSHHTFAHVYARGIAHRTIAIARSPLTYPPSIHPSIYLSIYLSIFFRPIEHGETLRFALFNGEKKEKERNYERQNVRTYVRVRRTIPLFFSTK